MVFAFLVRRGDVLSAWAGLRPLVKDPTKKDTASLARNHIIVVSDSNLITIAGMVYLLVLYSYFCNFTLFGALLGGKWTTYRHMAEETVDKAIGVCKLDAKGPCVTPGLLLEGAHDFNELMYIHLVQDYGLEVDVSFIIFGNRFCFVLVSETKYSCFLKVATHLAHSYGDRAFSVAKLAKLTGQRWPIIGVRIHAEFPYIESEVENQLIAFNGFS